MIYPQLAPIDWSALAGGDAVATAQIAARDRKLAEAAKLPDTVLALAKRLEERSATFKCTPAILSDEPLAGRWYLDLAGLTSKVSPKLRPGWGAAGLTISPETLATACSNGRPVDSDRLAAFSSWINGILLDLYPPSIRSADLALCTVLSIVGVRIDGRVRNQAGTDAVVILKRLLATDFTVRGATVEVLESGGWRAWTPAVDLLHCRSLRVNGRLDCEFIAGGNRPDIKVVVDRVVVLVGEVKGRSDLSNVWESWMPQIAGHLQTWTAENSQAPRIFFGTIITPEMIDGVTQSGTRQTGLKAFSNSGLLRAAYNLSNIVEGQTNSVAAFDDLTAQLFASIAD